MPYKENPWDTLEKLKIELIEIENKTNNIRNTLLNDVNTLVQKELNYINKSVQKKIDDIDKLVKLQLTDTKEDIKLLKTENETLILNNIINLGGFHIKIEKIVISITLISFIVAVSLLFPTNNQKIENQQVKKNKHNIEQLAINIDKRNK